MNRETIKLVSFIEQNEQYTQELKEARGKFSNYKDFTNKVGYIVMGLLNTEKEFFDYPRNDIELSKIVALYF